RATFSREGRRKSVRRGVAFFPSPLAGAGGSAQPRRMRGRAPPVSLMGFNPLLGRVSEPGNRFALFRETLYNPPMPRYRLILEYDGTPFAGWQRQADLMSVQQALEEAIARFSGETVVTHAAGRTDAGVHALGQVAHFDLARDWDANRIREAL